MQFLVSLGRIEVGISAVLTVLSYAAAISFLRNRSLSGICRATVMASFATVYPLSAVVHLARSSPSQRGFFDLLVNLVNPSEIIDQSLLVTGLAMVALWFGLRSGSSREPIGDHPPPSAPPFLLGGVVVLAAISVWANAMLFGGAENAIETMQTVDRVSETAEGMARYYFLARWLSWASVFFVADALARKWAVSVGWTQVIVLFAAAAGLANTYWRGGRGEGVYAALPAVIMAIRMRPRSGKRAALPVIVLGVVYMVSVTAARVGNDAEGGTIVDVVDWHAGRFSMVGFGIWLTDAFGYGDGTTLLSPLAHAINAPFYLMRLGNVVTAPNAMANLAGLHLADSVDVAGIVPGSICELYYNFGYLGVIVGYLLIGWATSHLSRIVGRGETIGVTALAAYYLVTIATDVIPGNVTGWIYGTITTGLPGLVVLAVERSGRVRLRTSSQVAPTLRT